jgi:hypothetical protein
VVVPLFRKIARRPFIDVPAALCAAVRAWWSITGEAEPSAEHHDVSSAKRTLEIAIPSATEDQRTVGQALRPRRGERRG